MQRTAGNLACHLLKLCQCESPPFPDARKSICQIIKNLYNKYDFLLKISYLNEDKKKAYKSFSVHY